MSAGDQIWSNLSIDALSILATSELINKDIENAIESEQKLDYDPDTRYRIAGRYLSDYLESFTSNHNARTLLESDHTKVLEPDYNTPFSSYNDVLDRLLPYHVYQHPDADLDLSTDHIFSDDKVLDFYRRRRNLYERFNKSRRVDLESKSQSNFILRQVNSSMKEDNVRLSQQLRELKGAATSTRSTTTTNNSANNAQIPLTLPYTRLGQLMSLGITPIPVANVQPGDQPACVLHGVLEDRNMVQLVVNFGSLNPQQLSSLAQILRTWVAENDRNSQNDNDSSSNQNQDTKLNE